METQPNKILIKEPNWLGDNMFTLPAIRKLREMFPHAHLSVLVKASLAPLWEIVPEIDEIISYNLKGGYAWRGFKDIKGKWGLIRSLRSKNFDLAVIFPRSLESALWIRLAGIPQRWGYQSEGRSWLLTRRTKSSRGYRHTHRIDYYYHLMDAASSDAPAPRADLNLPPELLSWAKGFLEEETGKKKWDFIVGLHPRASHGPAKCWPLKNYARLTELLVERNKATVLVFGNELEKEMAQTVVEAGVPRAFNLAGKTDLKRLAALIKLCDVFVANDSGPLHLAAASGVPVIGLFGSSDPRATGPRGEFSRFIYKNIPCSPCLRQICPTDFKCMTSITPEEVLLNVEELLNEAHKNIITD